MIWALSTSAPVETVPLAAASSMALRLLFPSLPSEAPQAASASATAGVLGSASAPSSATVACAPGRSKRITVELTSWR